jgi:hypothetical protein
MQDILATTAKWHNSPKILEMKVPSRPQTPMSSSITYQRISRSPHHIHILDDSLQQIPKLISQVTEDFADHASADEDERVGVAVGVGGAG